jgi:hypothetical protein
VKPNTRRGDWKAETALHRLRRCLAFLRSGDFLSASEQERVLKRVHRWKGKYTLRKVVRRKETSGDAKQTPPSAMRDTIRERFEAFHAANPQVFEHLVKLTQEQFLRGRERTGLKALWEQLRWHIAIGNLKVVGEYQLNNDFTSRYVRLLIEKYPAYRGLFEQRHLRSP